jgi:hypothetical protein
MISHIQLVDIAIGRFQALNPTQFTGAFRGAHKIKAISCLQHPIWLYNGYEAPTTINLSKIAVAKGAQTGF